MHPEARQMLREDGVGSVHDSTYVGALKNKWGDLLEGMPSRSDHDEYVKSCMAVLFENQHQHVQQKLVEETRTANVGPYTKFIFPVLRRVFPNLIANEIVSVQPMTAPVGAVFFLDYVYGSTKGGTTKGNVFPRDFDRDYTSEKVNGEMLATGDGAAYGGAMATVLSVSLAWTPVRPLDASKGYSVVITDADSAGTVAQTATDDGQGAFTFVPAGGNTGGEINYANGAISNFTFQTAPANGNLIKAVYWYDGELNTKIPEAQMDLKKAPVEAKSRRLKALWSSEATEDFRAFHGISADQTMTAAAAQNIALEIDREIIQDLFANSTGTTGSFDRVPPAGISEVDHLRSMLTTISSISGLIHTKTLRAPANWIVTSPEVTALVSQLTTHGDYRPIYADGQSSPYGALQDVRPGGMPHGRFGVYKVGTLHNKWVIYEDPFFTRDFMMIGLRGADFLDAGYVWAPYIPLQITMTFLDPNDFSFRKGLRTRYATKLLRSQYYGQMRVLNL